MINLLKKFLPLKSTNLCCDKEIILLAQNLAKSNRQLTCIGDFADVEFSAFSQWGEDGIIDWLISKIPDIPKSFVEFGVENYVEANTRLLIQLRNWRGVVIDGSLKNIQNIRSQDISWRYQLDSYCDFITAENINSLISKSGLSGEVGLLSIDEMMRQIQYLEKSIHQINPVIVVIEYNAVLGDLFPITIPYAASFMRTRYHYSNLYFGASLPALISLGLEKGYTFLGTNTTGVNAFFVRSDYSSIFTSGLIRNIASYPSLFRESRNMRGRLLFSSGLQRSEIIRDCPFENTITGEITTINTLDNIYSKEWMIGDRFIFSRF